MNLLLTSKLFLVSASSRYLFLTILYCVSTCDFRVLLEKGENKIINYK